MKSKLLYLPILLLASSAFGADPLPPEILGARGRYENALTIATKPIRERYVQELNQLKARAMSMKNLDLAVAIDQEIKAVTPVGAIALTAKAPLSDILHGTRWVAERGANECRFDGTKLSWIGKDGPPSRGYNYTIEKDGDTVSFTYSTNVVAPPLKFSSDRKHFQHGGTKYTRAAD